MNVRHFYMGLSSDDYLLESRPDSEFPYESGAIVSDFNFQSDFITNAIEKELKRLKYKTDFFNLIMIRGRKQPKKLFFIENHFKSLTIEIPFDELRYKELYPYENIYPLTGVIKPVKKEEEFNEFLFEMIIEGLKKANEQNAPIPYEFLRDAALGFKSKGYKNEWEHKKRTFKEHGIKASLCCKLTCNYFALELVVEQKKKETYRKEILRTLPSGTHYKYEFKDIKLENDCLIVTKDMSDGSNLFEVKLSEII